MGLSDLDCALMLQAQYDGATNKFDKTYSVEGVDFAIKQYSDCTLVCFEGSHDIPDWLSNFVAAMIRVPGVGGVETGFWMGLTESLAACQDMIPLNKPVYVTGHSRGAAHAHLFARLLIISGHRAQDVMRVVFGSPNPGDSILAGGLAESPVRSYKNFRNHMEQDFVCVVPEPIPVLAPYMHPGPRQIIDVPPLPNDPWLVLARHHLTLYISWLKDVSNMSVRE